MSGITQFSVMREPILAAALDKHEILIVIRERAALLNSRSIRADSRS